MRLLRLIAVPLLMVMVLANCGNDDDTTAGDGDGDGGGLSGEVTVLGAQEPEEGVALQAIIDDLIHPEVGYTAEIETSADFEEQAKIRLEGGNPPDILMFPQPGSVIEQARAGNLVSLEELGLDIAALEETFGEYFLSLGEYEGQHYGYPTNINLKSMVWYPKDNFDAAGYEVPETWDDLLALSDQIKADGSTPWCVGFESGGATGWPATDWMEDIVLRTAGTDVYDQWVNHEIPFDDPAIVTAAETFGSVMFEEGNVLGGAEQTTAIAFGDAPNPMFDEPPGCWLHRQASFINAFFPDTAEAGVDYEWFPLPPIDHEGILFAGELSAVTRNAPEVVDFLERFGAQDVQCAQGGDPGSSRISPNTEVGPDCYANDILADASEVLTTALSEGTGRFDASDLMPAAVGSGAFWTGMVEYMQAGSTDAAAGILADIEAAWPES